MKRSKLIELLQSQKKSCDIQNNSISQKIQRHEMESCKENSEPRWKYRHFMVLVGFLSLFMVNTHKMNMSVGIVVMVNHSAISQQTKAESESCLGFLTNTTKRNENSNVQEGQFTWTPEIQGYILGSYYLGFLASLIPSGILTERFGCKWFLFSSFFIMATFTFLVPLVSWLSTSAFIALELFRGLTQGFILSSVYVLASNWIPKTERGFLYTIMNSGLALGAFLGSMFTGLLCASAGGWPSSFYTFGAVSMIMSALVAFFLHESPKVHPNISEAELDFILSNQENKLSRRRPNPPWKKIFTSVPVYALTYAYFGQLWANSQFTTVHSTFLGTILHYPIKANGFFTALPFLLQFIMSQTAGWLSSYMLKKKFASVDHQRKFFNFLACLGFSTCLLGMYVVGCNGHLSVIFAILSAGFNGFGYAGCFVVAADMSPTFGGTLNAVTLTFGSFSTFILPLVVGYLTDGMQTIEQWNKIFLTSIGVVMSSGIIFAIFGSAKVQPWNDVQEETAENKENLKTRI